MFHVRRSDRSPGFAGFWRYGWFEGKIRSAEISSTLAIFGPGPPRNRGRNTRLASRQCGRRHGTGTMNRRSEAASLGIEADYIDAYGKRRTVPPDVIDRLLHALRAGGGTTLRDEPVDAP